jgi:O-methyltransferase involved in polyketide biosynthesis
MARLDTDRPHPARMWNFWCGGKDNFAADRALAEQVVAVYPQIVQVARASRAFLARAVSFLAAEAGVRQFLDIGTGLPTADNTHQVAQRIAPACRVVYVDNDPLVLAHARALLTSSPQGRCDYVDADVRDPDIVLDEAAATLDLSRPVALMMLGILGHVVDDGQAHAVVARLVAAVPPGSFLVVNDGTDTSEAGVAGARVRDAAGVPYRLRSPQQIAAFFDGLDVLAPGVVPTPRWRPASAQPPGEVDVYCGVGRVR